MSRVVMLARSGGKTLWAGVGESVEQITSARTCGFPNLENGS